MPTVPKLDFAMVGDLTNRDTHVWMRVPQTTTALQAHVDAGTDPAQSREAARPWVRVRPQPLMTSRLSDAEMEARMGQNGWVPFFPGVRLELPELEPSPPPPTVEPASPYPENVLDYAQNVILNGNITPMRVGLSEAQVQHLTEQARARIAPRRPAQEWFWTNG